MCIIGIRYKIEYFDKSTKDIEYSIMDKSETKAKLILAIQLEILNKIKCISNIEVYL